MPAGDRTGPMGMGPMTGKAMGYCGSNIAPSIGNNLRGRGMGMAGGRGLRGGQRNRFCQTTPGYGNRAWLNSPQTYSPEHEKELLRGEIAYLESNMNTVKNRLKSLEKQNGDLEKS